MNGKCYVGMTRRPLSLRLEEHLYSSLTGCEYWFSQGIRKHGVENFRVDVLEQGTSDSKLTELEIKWIRENKSFGKGYNMTCGGEGSVVERQYSQETLDKMSETARKRYYDGHGEYMRSQRKTGEEHYFYGVAWGRTGPLKEITKQRLSIAHTGKILSDDHKSAIAKSVNLHWETHDGPNKGKILTEEQKIICKAAGQHNKKPVWVINDDNEIIFAYLSIRDAAKETGFTESQIANPKVTRNGFRYLRSKLTIKELLQQIKDEK